MNLLLILGALCAVTAAMVPRERRMEEPRNGTGKLICAAETPCGWAFYKLYNTLIDSHAVNDYCQCGVSKTCQIDEDDVNGQSFIKKCKSASEDTEEEN